MHNHAIEEAINKEVTGESMYYEMWKATKKNAEDSFISESNKIFSAFATATLKACNSTREEAIPEATRTVRREAEGRLSELVSAIWVRKGACFSAQKPTVDIVREIVDRWEQHLLDKSAGAGTSIAEPETMLGEPEMLQDEPVIAEGTDTPAVIQDREDEDRLASILEAAPACGVHKRRYEIEVARFLRQTVTVSAVNAEEAHVLALRKRPPVPTVMNSVVTRTTKIGKQPVAFVHEDLSDLCIDHLTGKFCLFSEDWDDE